MFGSLAEQQLVALHSRRLGHGYTIELARAVIIPVFLNSEYRAIVKFHRNFCVSNGWRAVLEDFGTWLYLLCHVNVRD